MFEGDLAMKEKSIKIISIINIFFTIVIEMMLMNITYDIYQFNPINFAGIIIFIINLIGLYIAYKQANNKCMIIFLLMILLSIYQIIAIDAIGYRYLYLIGGIAINIFANK